MTASSPTATRVRVSDELFEAFRLASADESPLHVDDEYARATSFGGPVVYGVLGALIALSGLEPRTEPRTPKRISMRCPGPILRGQEYDRTVEQDTEQRAVVNVHDGEQPLLQLTADFEAASDTDTDTDAHADTHAHAHAHAHAETDTDADIHAHAQAHADTDAARQQLPDQPPLDHYPPARVTSLADFVVGEPVGGMYVPRWQEVGRVLHLLDLRARGIGPFHVAVLMWASYVVGMQAPGRGALLGEIDARFVEAAAAGSGAANTAPFGAAAKVKAVYDFASLLELTGEVVGEDGLAARVRIIAVHRTDG